MNYKIKKKQENSAKCLVCGLKNDLGLKAKFFVLENNDLVAIFTPLEEHQSYPNRLHGGMTSALLDETLGRSIMINYSETVWGVTVELNVRFKKPIPLNKEIKVVGRITKETGRYFEGSGEVYLPDGTVAAIGTGKYIKMGIEQIADEDGLKEIPGELEWRVYPENNDPVEIDI